MNELDARARAVLESFRRASSPTVARREAGLAAVEARIGAESDADEDEPVVAARSSTIFHVRSAAIAVAIAAGVLLAIRTVAFGVASFTADDAPARDAASDTPQPEPAPAIVEPSVPPEVHVAPAPLVFVEPAPSAPPAASTASPTRPSARARTEDDLVAEVTLLLAAKEERDAAAALVLLDRHAREFPQGSLSRERDVLRAERLCTLGRSADARALADRFLDDRATDPLAQRMRRVCRAE